MTMNIQRKRNRNTRWRVFLSSPTAVLGAVVAAVMLVMSGLGGPGVPRAETTGAAEGMEFSRPRLTIETVTGRYDFTVEVASTWERRAQGLQHRRTLAADAGMLFDYKVNRPVTMWMKNTYLPLDMLFIDAAGRVAHVARNTEPFSLTPIPSGQPVRAVLELNAGTAQRLDIRPGDRVHHLIFDAPAN